MAEAFRSAIDEYLLAARQESPSNVKDLFEFLVVEHDYPGSLRSLQRYVKAKFAPPAVLSEDAVAWGLGDTHFPALS